MLWLFRWYHGRLGRQVAEDRLRTAGETGSYLVRESERNKGSYVLSYLGKNGLTHFKYVNILQHVRKKVQNRMEFYVVICV